MTTTVGPPKTDAGIRDVAVPHTSRLIRAHLNGHTQPGREALLFPADSGGHLHEPVLYRHCNRAGSLQAGLSCASTTSATSAAQAGAPTDELQARLGHRPPTPRRSTGTLLTPRRRLAKQLSRLAGW